MIRLLLIAINVISLFVVGRVLIEGHLFQVNRQCRLRDQLDLIRGRYEGSEVKTLKYLIEHCGLYSHKVLEIGGGMGFISLQLIKLLEPRDLLVIEPIASNIQCLQTNIGKSPRVKIMNSVLVPNQDAGASFKFSENTEAIFGSRVELFAAEDQIITSSTNATSLRDIIDEFGCPDLIMMDVEGLEEFLLPEINALDVRTIIFEYHGIKTEDSLSSILARCDRYDFENYFGNVFVGCLK